MPKGSTAETLNEPTERVVGSRQLHVCWQTRTEIATDTVDGNGTESLCTVCVCVAVRRKVQKIEQRF